MQNTSPPRSPSQSIVIPSVILWRQVWGLAAMLAAILFGFMLYEFHQPKILMSLGFDSFAYTLGVAQGVLSMVVEPTLGALSDLILTRTGSRLPLITVGVTIAGLLFVVIALCLPIQLPEFGRWLVLVLMILWLLYSTQVRSGFPE